MTTGVLSIPFWHFQLPLQVILLGAITGTAYSLFGMGITLTYQSARVINFAQGAMGALPTILVAALVVDHGISYWIAMPLALLASVATGVYMELFVMRPLAKASRLVALVATLAAAQLFLVPGSYIVKLNHTKLGTTPYPIPIHTHIKLGNGLELGGGQILILVVAPLLLLGLTLFLRGTSLGMASRGVAENAEAAELAGVPIRRVSMTVWAIAGLLAGISGILLGPSQPVLATLFGAGGSASVSNNFDLLLRGLGAAMMGGLLSLPQVFGAGIAIGVVESLVRWNYPTGGSVDLVIVVLILGSMLARRDLRQAARGTEESSWSLSGAVKPMAERLRRHPRVRAAHRSFLVLCLGAVVVAPLLVSSPKRVLLSAIAIYAMISLSLVILTGWAGQISLGQFAFVALGALVGGRMQQLGYPLFGTVMLAVAAGTLAAAIVGLPALRMRGYFLAVATVAFAVLVDGWLTQQKWLVNASGLVTSMQLRRPTVAGVNLYSEMSFYYVVIGFFIATALLVHQLRRTGVGRKLLAVRDNEPMTAALSVGPAATKMLAFVISGAIASMGGYLLGTLLINFGNANLTSPGLSVAALTMVILGGSTSITGAILGALYVKGLPYFIHSSAALLLTQGGGLLGVLTLFPSGLAGLAFRVRDWVVARLAGVAGEEEEEATERITALRLDPVPRRVPEPGEPPALEASDIVVRFGGIAAVGGVSLHAGQGEIIGLMGPNGAGKTTLFDVLSGLTAPETGTVRLHGEDITELSPAERARIGLGRSFQLARLFDDLTVAQVLQLALEREEPTELVPTLLALPPANDAERRKRLKAGELMELLGLSPFAEHKAIELSTGTRRIVELGCTVALGADVILLDEPTGGIAQSEAEAFTPLLRQIRDHLDATMVVVAHDVPMIVGLVDRMYVLNSGLLIAEGPPSLLQSDPAVIAAYIGEPEEEQPERRPASRSRGRRAAVESAT